MRWKLRLPADYANINSYTHIHTKGDLYSTRGATGGTEKMTLKGEIRKGKELIPLQDEKAEREEEKFHICTQDNTVLPVNQGIINNIQSLVTGDVEPTGKVIESGNTLYKCQPTTGAWDRRYQCNDGIDNDGDGKVDYSNSYRIPTDTSCTGPKTTETGTPEQEIETQQNFNTNTDFTRQCKPKIIQEGDKLVALYDGEYKQGTYICDYKTETASQALKTGKPVTTGCQLSGNLQGNDPALQNYCQRIIKDAEIFFHNDKYQRVETVKYHIPKDLIPTTQQNKNLASQFIRNTEDREIGFSHSATTGRPCEKQGAEGGFVNTFCQTLHQAETYYKKTTYARTGALQENPHEASTWEKRNMTQLDGYRSTDSTAPAFYKKAWIVGNAKGESRDRIFTPNSQQYQDISSQGVFKGGFAGNCPTGQRWQFREEKWECSGKINWRHVSYIPDVDGGPDTKVGVFIESSTFNSGESNRPLESVWFRDKGESLDITHVDVMCFNGESFDSDMPDSRWFKKRVAVPDTVDEPFLAVTGEISTTETKYTCEYHFEAETGDGEELVFRDEGLPPKNIEDDEDLGEYVSYQVDKPGPINITKLESASETGNPAGNSDYPAKLS